MTSPTPSPITISSDLAAGDLDNFKLVPIRPTHAMSRVYAQSETDSNGCALTFGERWKLVLAAAPTAPTTGSAPVASDRIKLEAETWIEPESLAFEYAKEEVERQLASKGDAASVLAATHIESLHNLMRHLEEDGETAIGESMSWCYLQSLRALVYGRR